MPKHLFCQLSVGSRPSDTREDPLVDRASDGAEVQTSGHNRTEMMRLVDAVPVSEYHLNGDETLFKEHSDESHGNDHRSKDANKTPKTLDASSDDVSKNPDETPKETTVHFVRENESIKKNSSSANVNVSKGSIDANVHGTKPPVLARPPGSHYKVGDPPRRPPKPVWLEILCNLFTVRMFISSRCA